jgi:hypothetical protein
VHPSLEEGKSKLEHCTTGNRLIKNMVATGLMERVGTVFSETNGAYKLLFLLAYIPSLLVTALMFLGGIHFFPFYVKCQLEE